MQALGASPLLPRHRIPRDSTAAAGRTRAVLSSEMDTNDVQSILPRRTMPKKRASAAHKASAESVHHLPLVPQQDYPLSVQPSEFKKMKTPELRPAPESESDEVESNHDNADNGSENNESDDDLAPAAVNSSAGSRSVHDKR